MGVSTVAVIDKLLKNVYQPTWQTAFKEEYVGWKLATPQPRDFAGRKEIFPVEISRASGVGFRGEMGDTYRAGLPQPGGPSVENGEVDIRRLYGTLMWTHDAIARTKNNKGAFKRLLDVEVRAKFSRMLFEGEFTFYGDGRAVRATVAGNGAPVAIAAGAEGDVKLDTNRYMVRGDKIALWNAADALVIVNGGQDAGTYELIEVVKVYKDGITIKVKNNSAVLFTATDTDLVRNCGDSYLDSGGTRQDNAFVGLSAGIDDGTVASVYTGIDRTTWPEWQSAVVDAAGAQLDEDILVKGIDKVDRAVGEKIDTILWDISLRRDYVSITRPDRRYAPVKELDAGYSDEALVLTAGSKKVKLIEDTYCPFGVAFGISKDNLQYYELTPMEMDDSTGSVLKQGKPYGYTGEGDVFYAYIRSKGNFVVERPYAAVKWKGLAVTLE